ncbi:MAG TPA: calcium-binding protein [Fimbriiglobus sp.]|nr:calcium-binding protein [Fimbriiglobus sp.]
MTLSDCLARLHKSLLTGDPRRRAPERRRPLAVEPLEDRTVPSSIVWVNRGQASDNFDTAFGAGAPADAARAVIDAAIDAWNRVVTDFNHAAGIGPPDLQETISMNLGNAGFGAGTSTTIGADGKPSAGSVTINLGDPDGDGLSNWWVDPTPNDNSEFMGTINNAFTGTAQAGSPANGRFDLFSVALAELTHNMGIANAGAATARYNTGGFTTDTGVADDAEGGGVGNFWLFQGPSVASLMTNNNGGAGGSAATFPLHTAGPRANNAPIVFGGRTVFGVDDNGNAVGGGSQRTLVSNKTSLILKDAFDYDIVMPETFGSFYAVLNEVTGVLTVRGGGDNTVINNVNQGASSDTITVTRSGGTIAVSVNCGVDVPGTGTGFAANDQQDAFVSLFNVGQVTSIVVQAGDGNDAVTIGGDVGVPVSVDGQAGNDTLIGGDITLIGGAGNDYLYGSTGNDSLTGGDGNDTLYGLDGNDTLAGGNDNDQIYAGTGANTVTDGTGNDLIDLSQNAVAVNYATGFGNDTVIGTAFNDILTGSSGTDRLEGRGGNDQLTGAGGDDQMFGGDDSDTFVWNPGDGSDLIEGESGTDALAFNGSGSAEVFTLSAVGTRVELLRDLGGIDMDVAGVEQVNLNAGGGTDTATVNDLTTTGVQFVNVNVGTDGDSDGVTVNGRTVADNLLTSVSASVVKTAGLGYDVNVSGAAAADDTLTVNGNNGDDSIKAEAGVEATIAVVLNGGNGNDTLSADATLNGGADNDTLVGGAGNDTLNGGAGNDVLDGRGSANTLDGGADTDTILVSGTSGADTIAATHGAGSFNITGGPSAGTNTISGMEAVRVEAGDGADGITLNLLAAGGLNYTVLGGDPIGTLAGDSLTINSSAAMTVTTGPENDAGSVDAATTTPTNVSFDEIEVLIIGGGGGAVVNGTNGNDAITVIARDDSYNPAANGVQDFTAVVNAGLEVLYLDQPSLIVNALGGADTVVVRAPAPNNALWDVAVTIDGGAPSAGDPSGSDRVVVETPGAAVESVNYLPTSADAGTLDLVSLSSPVALVAIEELLYDGEADDDSLTVVGTAGPDTIAHTPGAGDQEGAFRVNGFLAIGYQNMGAGAVLTADGAGDADTFAVHGTAVNDSFAVDAAGVVSLNTRLALHTTAVESLTMEGLLGDDLFDILPPLPTLVYGQVNANGGGQSSATGDRTVVRGTAGDDVIGVSGQTVALGGKTVASSGVEGIVLDAGGGTADEVTYTGVAGVAEAINFISSGVGGGGQINVPGVALVTFTGVEVLDAVGNLAAAGDEDTLTLTGTNALDRLEIDLAAAGTNADPVLQLLNSSGSATLLTLRNYANFDTLRVSALEGEDVINVYTAGGGPSRNLFVDGGAPSGKKKSTDKLTVFYTPPRPSIIHSTETQDPDNGLIDLDYDTARFLIQYADIEKVVITRL